MLIRALILLLSSVCSSSLWAITCYYTLAKDNCWLNYNVTVNVMDAMSTKVLTTVSVPAGQAWARVTFPCETNGQKLIYSAQFTPFIWESEKGKVYSAKNVLLLIFLRCLLPQKLKENAVVIFQLFP
jgi:hypothetical protein